MRETMRTTLTFKNYRQYSLFIMLVYLSVIKFSRFAEAQHMNDNYIFSNGNGSVEIDYEIDFDSVSMYAIYNKTSDIVQYVIKWIDPLPIYGCAINIFPLSACGLDFNSSHYADENTTEFHVPLMNGSNFYSQKDCVYKIEVENNYRKLNAINYFLDTGDAKRNTYIPTRTILIGAVYNRSIDGAQYVIKWKDAAPLNGYEINIQPNDLRNYCKTITYHSHHISRNIKELFIPSSSTHDFKIRGSCTFDIKIYANDRIIKFTDRISADVEVKKFLVYTIYNKSIKRIQYVMKWNDVPPESGYYVTVTPESKYYCDSRTFNSFHLNASVTELLVPPEAAYDFKIFGNCTNYIAVKADGININITNRIPICVDSKCNCLLLSPKPSNTSVDMLDPNLYNVSWHFPETKENNITSVLFYLYNETCESSHYVSEIQPSTLKNNYAVLDTTNVPKGRYCISTNFMNNFSCSHPYSNIFEVFPVHHIPDEGVSSWIHWVIIFVFVTIAMLVVIYYLQAIQSCIHKWQLEHIISRQNDRHLYPDDDIRKEGTHLLPELKFVEKPKEFPRKDIHILNRIGGGAFGEVLLAKIIINGAHKFVAAKRLRESTTLEEKEDFASEIEILKTIGYHPNIVTLIGCCTLEEPFIMIMELVPCGDLKHYLLDLRNKWRQKDRICSSDNSVFTSRSSAYIVPGENSPPTTPEQKISTTTQYVNISIDTPRSDMEFNFRIESVLDHRELQDFALQIARGMEYLERIPIAHRDLAARNILINERKELKISDFGLSRKGPYINSKPKRMPLRWMAIESIEDHLYDNKSDVWSFAVVLWEIGTLGAFPYEMVPDSMLFYYLQNGKRLQRPEICTDELYTLMLRCWNKDKDSRPSFSELVEYFKRTRAYVDFNQLNPLYVFPPSDDNRARIPPKLNGENIPMYLECA